MIVVIPTCRGVDLHHLAPLIEHGCRFIVIDDTAGSIRVDHPRFAVYTRADRVRLMGRNAVAIPSGNGACRDFGFYIAWKEGDADELVIALDDDCVVESEEFVRRVLDLFEGGEDREAQGQGRHFNIFDLYDDPAVRRQFPRGFPYSSRVDYRPWTVRSGATRRIEMNLGLWKGILDVNAVDRAPAQDDEYPDASLSHDNVVVPGGALVSLCSGSMQFRRSVIPAIYQLPMNVEVMPGWTINRYGDIWGGYILKTLMDRRGDCLSVGQPLVRHSRLGHASSNVRSEHLAHLVNEEFIELVAQASETLESNEYTVMMAGLREQFVRLAPSASPVLRAYLRMLDPSLLAWLRALDGHAL